MVSFGRVAREVKPERLPEATWDFEWGTNMQHALALARKMLSTQTGRKQIIMITDGEPTAHIEDGYPYFDYPPSPRTIEMTLREVQRCTATTSASTRSCSRTTRTCATSSSA